MVDPLLIAVLSTVVGAGLNTVRGYLNSDGEGYSARKLFGAIIVSTFAGIAVSQTIAIDGMSALGIGLIGLTTGFTVDYVVTRSKKDII